MAPESVLSLSGLVFRYPPGFELRAERLDLVRGEAWALTGPNGSGKTTLLHILALLLAPGEGEYRLAGRRLELSGPGSTAARRKMTLVEQNPGFFRGTVRENIAAGLRYRRLPAAEIERRVAMTAGELGIGSFLDRPPSALSAGERQKAALARGLALDPEVLLLDEPTANLDRESRDRIEEAVRGYRRRRGGTVVWATHNLRQAFRVGDRVMSLVGGRIIPGTIENFFSGRVEIREGETVFCFGPGLEAVIAGPAREGPARLLLPPEEIILSRGVLDSSLRNSFPGRVVGVEERGARVAVRLDIGVEVAAVVTAASYRRLDLHLGSPLRISFKAAGAAVV